MVDRAVQSRVRTMAMVLSSAELSSLLRVGKYRAVMLDEWWSSDPSSLFFGFSVMEPPLREGSLGCSFDDAGGGAVEMEYRFIRSSVLPVASVTLDVSSDSGEMAMQRIADAWALNRNVSVKSTFGRSASDVEACSAASRLPGMDAAKPWRTLS